jgi:hypothetical protein
MAVRSKASAVLVTGLLLVAGAACGDDGGSSADRSVPASTTETTESTGTTETSETGEAAAGEPDLETFCAAFPDLGGQGAESTAMTAEQWDMRIATTEAIAASAPDEVAEQADAYVVMMQARAELAAENGYAAATDIDPAVRQEFIGEVGALQQQVNELIAYAQAECGLG